MKILNQCLGIFAQQMQLKRQQQKCLQQQSFSEKEAEKATTHRLCEEILLEHVVDGRTSESVAVSNFKYTVRRQDYHVPLLKQLAHSFSYILLSKKPTAAHTTTPRDCKTLAQTPSSSFYQLEHVKLI